MQHERHIIITIFDEKNLIVSTIGINNIEIRRYLKIGQLNNSVLILRLFRIKRYTKELNIISLINVHKIEINGERYFNKIRFKLTFIIPHITL